MTGIISPDSVAHTMEWRACVDFPEFEVSEWGDLRRVVASQTRQVGDCPRGFVDSDGYLRYILRDADGQKVSVQAHRLVAIAFIGAAPTDLHEVAHNNGSRKCIHHSELRWATRAENHHDTFVHGTTPGVGERNPKAKLTETDVRRIRREYRAIKNREVKKRVSDLAAEYGLHHATVCNIARGKSWSHIPLEAA